MLGIGGTQIIIILVIGLVIFWAIRPPELGKGPTGIRESKKDANDLRHDLEDSLEDKSLVLKPPPREANELRR